MPTRYADHITMAARIARLLRGGQWPPGAKQIARLEAALGGQPPLRAVRLSREALRRVATGDAPLEVMYASPRVRALLEEVGDDPLLQGRPLAAALVGLSDALITTRRQRRIGRNDNDDHDNP